MNIQGFSTAIPAVLIVGITAAHARTIYVSPSGDDGNPGAQESPLRTIGKAAEVARAGDVVLVRAGAYKGQLFLRRSGEPGRPIVFKGAPGEKPVVDGEGKGRIELQSELGWRKPIGWVTVEGFEIRNGWDGIKFYNAHHIVLKGNSIHDNLNQGILGNGHHVRIEGNVIFHNGFKPDNEKSNLEHGIYATGTDFEIVDNVIHSNRAYGIQVAGYPFKPDSHAGPEFASARRWLISHNTIAFEQNRSGIVVWQEEATDCVIENNIFFRNSVKLGRGDCQGVDFVGAGGGHIIRNNLFFGPGRVSISGKPGGFTASDDLEDKDPLFVDADRFDFHLRKGSPAIDSGKPQENVAVDIEHTPRPRGRAPDMGAFEYHEGTASGPSGGGQDIAPDDHSTPSGRPALRAPYPPSFVLRGVRWEFDRIVRFAPGSDLWPIAWAGDGHLYTSWGDGGGFGGTNDDGRVTVGVAALEGSPPDFSGKNVFGGKNCLAPATFTGKSNGILAIGDTLYLSVVEEGKWLRSRIGRSEDHGKTWRFNGVDWDFAEPDGAFSDISFLTFGKGYEGARDGFVYAYSQDHRARATGKQMIATSVALFRAPRDKVQDRGSYEYFAGLDAGGNPLWTREIAGRKAVFGDPNGVGWGVRVAYHPGFRRYLLTVFHDDTGGWGLFDAPEPWGPWTTVGYWEKWIDTIFKFGFTFSQKWMEDGGRTAWMVFSGIGLYDSFNAIKVGFEPRQDRPASEGTPPPLQRLKVSEDRRSLVTEDGKPFFWLGDTAWSLRLLAPEDVDFYMTNRARHRFNVLQVHCGYTVTSHGGHRPFVDGDTDKPDEAFWRTVDVLVAKALENRLYIALVPLWGDEYGKAFGKDAGKAARLGKWLGKRYAARAHVLWITSGEYDAINGYRLPISAEQKSLFTALASGLREAHGGAQLMTLHPGVALTSSKDFHGEPWLDLDMLQSGHMIDSSAYGVLENHALIAHDRSLRPVKPVLDGEPIYEDTPDGVWARRDVNGPRADAAAVRRKAYWAVFAGACGHTYGHNDVYGFFEPARPGEVESFSKGPGRRGSWKTALDAPGAVQMKHLRALLESRPLPGRIPDPTLVAGDRPKGLGHIAATRASDGSYVMVYIPSGNPVRISLGKISGRAVTCWWFDPRTGDARAAGEREAKADVEFRPPSGEDWVLVLDDAAKKYPPPGRP